MVAGPTDRRTYKRMLLYDDSYYEGRGFAVFHTRPPAIPRARRDLDSQFFAVLRETPGYDAKTLRDVAVESPPAEGKEIYGASVDGRFAARGGFDELFATRMTIAR